MAAISDGLETAANRPGANVAARRSSGWGATKGLMIPSDRQCLHYQFERIVLCCKCRGVAANDLPRVTGSSEQKSSTNFAPEAHMRIRFGIRPEAPIVL